MARSEKTASPPPQSHTELFVALVAPIGTDMDAVVRELTRQLRRYAYKTDEIHLSQFLERLTWPEARSFSDLPYDERTWAAMDAGNDLRTAWKDKDADGAEHEDALALLAISEIEAQRVRFAKKTGAEIDPEAGAPTLERQAWVLRSLKTPAEARTLRDVYGPRFFLIAAQCPELLRARSLRAKIKRDRPRVPERDWTYAPSQLIDRDWKEERAGGQNVRGTFHQADFFIDARDSAPLAADVTRVLDILFADPYKTPTVDEYAMFSAAGAAKRSAELGRQVGAALVSGDGSLVALGMNEVPAAGGGPYLESTPGDRREFRLERDTNRARQEEIAEGIDSLMQERVDSALEQLVANLESKLGDQAQPLVEALNSEEAEFRRDFLEDLPRAVLEATEVGDLTEFGRATHAEMSALLDAARRGVSVRGTTLYTTTFPCHNCARHMVEAGIKRVVFIEPYAKSRALELHKDSIALAGDSGAAGKVVFEPFVGVAPRAYLALFDAGDRELRGYPKRKDGDGWTTDFESIRTSAWPLFTDREAEDIRPNYPVYRLRERVVLRLLDLLFKNTGIQLKEKE